MITVTEYDDNGGKLKNFFRDITAAREFADKMIRASAKKFEQIEPDHWYCKSKMIHIKIEADK